MILNEPVQDISFYDKQSFCCRESRDISIPKELTLDMNVKRDLKFPNLSSSNQDNYMMTNPSRQFISLSKIDTANTPDQEFQQTANFFFPQFEQQTQKQQEKEIDIESFQKARGHSLFTNPIENENNQFQQQSLSGVENDSNKKKIRFSRVLVNQQASQNEEKQPPARTLKRSVISMSQPKLHSQGGSSAVNHNSEKETSIHDQMASTHNQERKLSQKKMTLETREKGKVLNRQNILNEQQQQKEQNSQIIQGGSVQKPINLNSNNNSIITNAYSNKDQQDLRLNNFIQLLNEKQQSANSAINNHNFQLNNIFPQSTSNIQRVSRDLFGKQHQKQQIQESTKMNTNPSKYQKPILRLPDENSIADSNQALRDMNPSSCQPKFGTSLNDKQKNLNGNNISAAQNLLQLKQSFYKNVNQVNFGAQNFYGQSNKSDLNSLNQQHILINNQSNQVSKQISRKASSSCLEDLQKNLVDDNFMQELKQQQMNLLKIRYQQMKNFQDLNSNASPIENNILSSNNNANLLMRQDIKGQLLYSSQQDSRRNNNSLTKNPFNNYIQNSSIARDLRNLQVISSDNKKLSGNMFNQDDNLNRYNLNLINTIKQRTINSQKQADNFNSKAPLNLKNQNPNQIPNDFDDSEENIKLDPSQKNLFHRRSVAGVFSTNPIKNNNVQKDESEEQAISEIEKMRRQIKETINKGVRNDIKNNLQTLPQLNSIQTQQQQLKKIESCNNINFTIPKKIYQPINSEAFSKIQNNFDDGTASGRDAITLESNYTVGGKISQCKTFLQRKPQENIVNKIFQIPNEIILE